MGNRSSVILQCLRPSCRFRFPATLDVQPYQFCPKCGGPLEALQWNAPENLSDSLPEGATIIEVLLDNIRSAYNVGSIFRTSDGAGVGHIYLCGYTPTPANNQVAKTALGAEMSMPWSQSWNALEVITDKRAIGFKILTLEGGAGSDSLFNYMKNDLPDRILLVLGNENNGVDPAIRAVSDWLLSLPMLGKKESLNVATAFGIAIYTLRFGLKS